MNTHFTTPNTNLPFSTKVEGTPRAGSDIGTKRLLLPGVVVRSTCPSCGVPWESDLGERPLTGVRLGTPTNAYGCCSKCEHEWPVLVTVTVSVTAAPTEDSR